MYFSQNKIGRQRAPVSGIVVYNIACPSSDRIIWTCTNQVANAYYYCTHKTKVRQICMQVNML